MVRIPNRSQEGYLTMKLPKLFSLKWLFPSTDLPLTIPVITSKPRPTTVGRRKKS